MRAILGGRVGGDNVRTPQRTRIECLEARRGGRGGPPEVVCTMVGQTSDKARRTAGETPQMAYSSHLWLPLPYDFRNFFSSQESRELAQAVQGFAP